MSLPPITQSWLFSLNNRITFVSLNDTMARLLYGIKNFLVATCGYTVKYTCNGTTGPSSSSDHTDRWTSSSACTTRGASASAAQSFAVLTDGNGVDILFTYQANVDDICRISISPSGAFVPAGTSNQQPTATDEAVFQSTAATLVGGGTSLDRVWHIMASTDNKMFRSYILRSSTLQTGIGVELVTSSVVAANTFPAPVVGWVTSVASNLLYSSGGILGSTTTNNLGVTRINGITATCGGGGESYFMSTFTPAVQELQAASLISSVATFATNTNGCAGKVGARIDIWPLFCTGIGQGDTLGSLAFIYLATHMLPWDGVTAPAIA